MANFWREGGLSSRSPRLTGSLQELSRLDVESGLKDQTGREQNHCVSRLARFPLVIDWPDDAASLPVSGFTSMA